MILSSFTILIEALALLIRLTYSEDIDFEFVYALHSFTATVEGQANATKGETMVLLDDSNSYWWLVRVEKDSSIGVYCCHHCGLDSPSRLSTG